jgi:hypothetical protein
MAVAIVMDFPGGTREQYDQVLEKMDLGGRVPDGGLHHTAGATDDGWRVLDVWESMDKFQSFAQAKIRPYTAEVGLPEPQMRVVDLHNHETTGDDADIRLVQILRPPIDAATYDEVHAKIADPLPEGGIWHVAGRGADGDWYIIDAWVSREARDRFDAERVRPVLEERGMSGPPPERDDLDVQATLATTA